VEKCNFCHGRRQAAEAKAAAAERKELDPSDYVPACVEACPSSAITFGDLADESTEASRLARGTDAIRLLEKLGTEPKIYYRSQKEWARQAVAGRREVEGV
jgi:menaquinone reductase, iron-sulfur cluster-binding subunit